MRQLVIGGILVLWGLGILVRGLFLRGDAFTSGAYAAGQSFALLIAVLMVVAGGRAILKGKRERRA